MLRGRGDAHHHQHCLREVGKERGCLSMMCAMHQSIEYRVLAPEPMNAPLSTDEVVLDAQQRFGSYKQKVAGILSQAAASRYSPSALSPCCRLEKLLKGNELEQPALMGLYRFLRMMARRRHSHKPLLWSASPPPAARWWPRLLRHGALVFRLRNDTGKGECKRKRRRNGKLSPPGE